MAVNKVELNGKTLIDLTSDSVSPETLLAGQTAHDASGNRVEGAAVIPTKVSELENDVGYAKTESPTLTGVPKAPTPTADTNNAQIATTAYVKTLISNLVNGAPETLDTLKEIADALGENNEIIDALNAAIGNKVDKENAVIGVKGTNNNSYRNGLVELSADDIGAIPQTRLLRGGDDLNDFCDTDHVGLWFKAGNTTLLNWPDDCTKSMGMTLLVLRGGNTTWIQILYANTTSSKRADQIYIRVIIGTTAQPWIRQANRVKGDREADYRGGDVNITPANIGAVPWYHDNGVGYGDDWDSFIDAGTYKVQNASMDEAHHAPLDLYNYGVLIVFLSENPDTSNEKRKVQLYVPHVDANISTVYDFARSTIAFRTYNGGSWGVWYGFYAASYSDGLYVKKSDVIPIDKGGTGKTTAVGALDALTSAARAESPDYAFSDNDELLWLYNQTGVTYQTKFLKLWKYIKTKSDATYLLKTGKAVSASSADSANTATTANTANKLKNFDLTSTTDVGQYIPHTGVIGYAPLEHGIFDSNDGAVYGQRYSDKWAAAIYQDYRTGRLAVRGLNNGTWQSVRKIVSMALNGTDPDIPVVSKSSKGLVPQLPNETVLTKFLRQDGSWAAMEDSMFKSSQIIDVGVSNKTPTNVVNVSNASGAVMVVYANSSANFDFMHIEVDGTRLNYNIPVYNNSNYMYNFPYIYFTKSLKITIGTSTGNDSGSNTSKNFKGILYLN